MDQEAATPVMADRLSLAEDAEVQEVDSAAADLAVALAVCPAAAAPAAAGDMRCRM